MSLRLRILALVVLVGVTATAATAWLTLRQVSQQITESAVADRATIEQITTALEEYGRTHGTWVGVASVVRDQADAAGQRIRLVAAHGEVLVDTDHLAGQAARPPASPPISVNPRPVLTLPPGLERPKEAAIEAFLTYRHQVMYTACLAGHNVEVRDSGHGVYGIPLYHLEAQQRATRDVERSCNNEATQYNSRPVPPETFDLCERGVHTEVQLLACLGAVFDEQADQFAPVPVNLYLGAVDEDPPLPLAAGPVLSSAALVAVTAIAGTLLISRRLLRPIGALTAAARRVGAGQLTERVPATGNDELAGLARTFNQMADSLWRSEERQRRLVADVAHELRTPLANLRGYLEALKDGVLAPGPELFTSLHEETLLQQRLVDDLQDLALAEAGSLVYRPEPVELGELLEASRAAHQAAAGTAGVQLAVSAPAPVPVRVDLGRFRQVIANLVANALRATGPGGSVRLSAVRTGASAVVTVTDTGAGIAPADLPHVFDRFWRADIARGRTTGGSGLGLAIARQIVTDHSGTIAVVSTPGTGTRFTITLPALDGPPALGDRRRPPEG